MLSQKNAIRAKNDTLIIPTHSEVLVFRGDSSLNKKKENTKRHNEAFQLAHNNLPSSMQHPVPTHKGKGWLRREQGVLGTLVRSTWGTMMEHMGCNDGDTRLGSEGPCAPAGGVCVPHTPQLPMAFQGSSSPGEWRQSAGCCSWLSHSCSGQFPRPAALPAPGGAGWLRDVVAEALCFGWKERPRAGLSLGTASMWRSPRP